MQPGVLGNYRGEPPSEHMCFPHTNLHKDSTWPVCFLTFHPYLNNRHTHTKKENRTATHISKLRLRRGSCVFFLRVKKYISDSNFRRHFCFVLWWASFWNIPLFSVTGAFAAFLLSCWAQKLPLCFSTGVCGSHCRRAGSCKLLISLRTHESPSLIESAYTCNHILQPSDWSILSPTGRDKLSPSAVAPCTLNIIFIYTWTHFT